MSKLYKPEENIDQAKNENNELISIFVKSIETVFVCSKRLEKYFSEEPYFVKPLRT